MKIHIVTPFQHYYRHYSNWIEGVERVRNPEKADILLFPGGEDICPALYGEKEGSYTYTSPLRDRYELDIFDKYSKGKFIIGICRGAQLMTVLSGGKLIQHVEGHVLKGNGHWITTNQEEKYVIPSRHHQMCYPKGTKHELIAWSTFQRSTGKYLDGNDHSMNIPEGFLEPEIIHYPNINALCIQGHPEMTDNDRLHTYLNKLIKKYKT